MVHGYAWPSSISFSLHSHAATPDTDTNTARIYYHTSDPQTHTYARLYCGILEKKNISHCVINQRLSGFFSLFLSLAPSLAHHRSRLPDGTYVWAAAIAALFILLLRLLLLIFIHVFFPNRTLHFGFFFAGDACVCSMCVRCAVVSFKRRIMK